jgi:signal transduction histidine kinase
VELRLPEEVSGRLAPSVEQGVYRIAQEALENVVRHAEAQRILVHLEQGASDLQLTIEDDGRGLDLEASLASEDEAQESLGIRGMKERANLIGGELQITSQSGQGTQLHLTVPTTLDGAAASLPPARPLA